MLALQVIKKHYLLHILYLRSSDLPSHNLIQELKKLLDYMKSWSIIQRMSWLGLSLLGLNDSFFCINVLYSAHINCVPFLPYNRSVCQLVRLLEKFKSKIRSQICKKSSKILLDAGEKVHLQLQHAESQMEADL